MALKPAIVRKRMWDNPWESRYCWKVVPGSLVRTEIIGPLFLSYRRKRMSLLIHVSGSTYYSRPFEWYWGFRGSLKVIHICGETSDPLTFLGWKSGGTNRSTGFRVSTRANGLSLHSILRNFNFDIPTIATNVAPLIPAGLIGLIIFGSAYIQKKHSSTAAVAAFSTPHPSAAARSWDRCCRWQSATKGPVARLGNMSDMCGTVAMWINMTYVD